MFLLETSSSDLFRDWAVPNYGNYEGWGNLKINPEVYDRHFEAYPDDSLRMDATFMTWYTRYRENDSVQAGDTLKTYPHFHDTIMRGNQFKEAFPIAFKYTLKDKSLTSKLSNRNTIIYRYADLLMMLAEISNELDMPEKMDYVTEVLERVGLTPADRKVVVDPNGKLLDADYFGTREEFREAIMAEVCI